jgi:DNA ligase-4
VRTKELHSWQIPGNGDLGACLEKVLRVFDVEPKPGSFVTVEEVDIALHAIAARCRFSGPEVRSKKGCFQAPHEILRPIFLRLKSSEAKWLTRLILKNLSPVVLDPDHVLQQYHFLLPGLLQFQDSFKASIALIKGPLKRYHAKPDFQSQLLFKQEALKLMSPQVGVKVGRPPFVKARSFEHCLQMAAGNSWSIERKYDGEYCEVHINLESKQTIQIFSKSGKDSTQDRKRIHSTLRECLRIDKADCGIKKRCILVGELVVYSDEEEKILEFHEIRKHVTRSGVLLGTEADSTPRPHEHLMIVFYDVLLVDDEATMNLPHTERRERLSALVQKKDGHAITCEWKIHDFSRSTTRKVLVYQLVHALANRTEGLILKPSDSPYFSFDSGDRQKAFIKLKKDYMQEFGEERDIVDLAVVGASFDPKQAQRSRLKGLKYTNYYLGCLTNPLEVRFGETPSFEVVACIEQHMCIPTPELQALNNYALFKSGNHSLEGETQPNEITIMNTAFPKMSLVFAEPCVVEVLGSGYDKPSNKNYFMLRHPRILRLHLDRDWKDAASLEKLQSMADKARNEPSQGESQEMQRLFEKLQAKYHKKQETQRLNSIFSTQRSERTESIATTEISIRKCSRSDSLEIHRSGRQSQTKLQEDRPILVHIDSCELQAESCGAKSSLATHLYSESAPTQSLSRPTQSLSERHRLRLPSLALGHRTLSAVPLFKGTGTPSTSLTKKPLQQRQLPLPNAAVKTAGPFTFLPTPPSSEEQLKTSGDKSVPISNGLSKKRQSDCISRSFPAPSKRIKTVLHSEPVNISKSLDLDTTLNIAVTTPSRRTLTEITADTSCSCISKCSTLRHFTMALDNQGPHLGACLLNKHGSAPKCPFESAVVHVGKWIRNCPHIQFNLLDDHGAERTSFLSEWVRENFTMDFPVDEIAESQSHPGKLKIIIVNLQQELYTSALIHEVKAKKVRDRVLWFHWLVLEDWKKIEETYTGSVTDIADLHKCFIKNYFGKTVWIDGDGMAFIPADEDELDMGLLFPGMSKTAAETET